MLLVIVVACLFFFLMFLFFDFFFSLQVFWDRPGNVLWLKGIFNQHKLTLIECNKSVVASFLLDCIA